MISSTNRAPLAPLRLASSTVDLSPKVAAALGAQLVNALQTRFQSAGVPLRDLEKYLDLSLPVFHDGRIADQLNSGATALQVKVGLKLRGAPPGLVEAAARAVLDAASQKTRVPLGDRDSHFAADPGVMYVLAGSRFLKAVQASPLVQRTQLHLNIAD